MKTDKRIDTYISKSADFAQPILTHLRQLVHKACPEVTETIKWSFPNFEYNNSILCSMAAFKQHAVFGFWLGSLMKDSNNLLTGREKTSMGNFGKIESLKDLPSDKILIQYMHEAMKLSDSGAKLTKKPVSKEPKELVVPDYFLKALKKSKLSHDTFVRFSYSQKKEYVDWITEAKTDATRLKRMETAIEWLAEGKIRNWKYLKC